MTELISALLGMAGRSGDLAYNELNYWRSRAQEKRLHEREDTAIQRRVADLEAAGLNPLLAAGSPASSGMVSQHYGSSDFGGLSGELQDFLKNNYDAIKEKQEIDVNNSKLDGGIKEAQIDLLESQKAEADAKVLELMSSIESLNIKTRELAHNLSYYESLGLPTNSPSAVKTAGVVSDKLNDVIEKYDEVKSEKEILKKITEEKKEGVKSLKKENKLLKNELKRRKFSKELENESQQISNLPFMNF